MDGGVDATGDDAHVGVADAVAAVRCIALEVVDGFGERRFEVDGSVVDAVAAVGEAGPVGVRCVKETMT